MSDPVADIHGTGGFEIDPRVLERRRVILIINCAAVASVVMSISALNVTLPSIQRDLGSSGSDLQWIVEAYVLVFAGLLLPAGALGDRFGRRLALLSGLLVYGTAMFLAAESGSSHQLIGARAMMGVGAAFVMPTTLSIVVCTHLPIERSRAIAQWAASSAIGGLLGPISSGLILHWFAWGGVLLTNAVAVAVMFVLAAIFVPESRDPERRPIALLGTLLSIGCVVCLVFGVIDAPVHGWLGPRTLIAAALAALAGAAFVMDQLRIDHPMLDPRLFRHRQFRNGSIAISLAFSITMGMIFLVSQYLQFVKGFSPIKTALHMIPGALVITIVARRTPQLVKRYSGAAVLRCGLLCDAAGLVLLATLRPGSFTGVVIAAIAVMGLANALIMAPATQQIVSAVPPGKTGVGSAVNDLTREIGGALGLAIASSIAATVYHAADVGGSVSDPAVRSEAGESIGRALAAARSMDPPSAASQLVADAKRAFTDGTRVTFALVATIAAVAAYGLTRRHADEEER